MSVKHYASVRVSVNIIVVDVITSLKEFKLPVTLYECAKYSVLNGSQ